jgi:hypothetical protein
MKKRLRKRKSIIYAGYFFNSLKNPPNSKEKISIYLKTR